MNSPTNDHEVYEHLLMRAVDGELGPGEQQTLEAHLAECEQCREELADFRLIKEDTDMLTRRILATARVEAPRDSAANRWVVAMGTALFVLSMLLFAGFGLYELMTDSSVSIVIKLATGLGTAAGLLFLVYVLFIRKRASEHDPYEEIDQ